MEDLIERSVDFNIKSFTGTVDEGVMLIDDPNDNGPKVDG